MRPFARQPIIVKRGDLLAQRVQVIVNPANERMKHAGGLARVIAMRGGEELIRASKVRAPVPTGEAIITTAGRLPFKAVVHAVGPIWDPEHAERCAEQLRSAHVAAIMAAHDAGYRNSIAFPAVSCGIFGYPVDKAAPVALQVAREAVAKGMVRQVVFCLFEAEHLNAYQGAFLT